MTTYLYAGEILVIFSGVWAMLYLKRAGERAWRIYLFQQRLARLNAMMRGVTTALNNAATEMNKMGAAFARVGEQLLRAQDAMLGVNIRGERDR